LRASLLWEQVSVERCGRGLYRHLELYNTMSLYKTPGAVWRGRAAAMREGLGWWRARGHVLLVTLVNEGSWGEA